MALGGLIEEFSVPDVATSQLHECIVGCLVVAEAVVHLCHLVLVGGGGADGIGLLSLLACFLKSPRLVRCVGLDNELLLDECGICGVCLVLVCCILDGFLHLSVSLLEFVLVDKCSCLGGVAVYFVGELADEVVDVFLIHHRVFTFVLVGSHHERQPCIVQVGRQGYRDACLLE